METIDVICLSALCVVICAGFLFRDRRIIHLSAVLILFVIGFGSVATLSAIGPRLAVKTHERQNGNVSTEAIEGIKTANLVSRPWYPYILFSIFGLTILAALRPGKNKIESSPTSEPH